VKTLLSLAIVLGSVVCVAAQPISLRADAGRILYGDLYGSGDRGVVVLAHGGYSSRASWRPTAEAIGAQGFHVLVIEAGAAADFAAGKETPCLSDAVCQSKDVLAAVAHLRRLGARTISLIGGSMGGAAVAHAAIDAGQEAIESVVLLAPAEVAAPEKIPGRKLFITAERDANSAGRRLPGIKAQYARARQPKELVLVEGSAHGQNMFTTPQGADVLRDIVRFLKNGRP
jgi:alpha-beta hydrolase superfamily lysophospholipase